MGRMHTPGYVALLSLCLLVLGYPSFLEHLSYWRRLNITFLTFPDLIERVFPNHPCLTEDAPLRG